MARLVFSDDPFEEVDEAEQRRRDQASAVFRTILREVREQMAGEPTDDVHARLTALLAERLGAERPDVKSLRDYAEAIHEGTLMG